MLLHPLQSSLSVSGADANSVYSTSSSWGSDVGIHQHIASSDNSRMSLSYPLNKDQEKAIIQSGDAYWSGDELQNRLTASGEEFNKNEMTASHPYLPFETQVRVRNLLTNQVATVRINDRQQSERLIGLTEAAAQKIGMIEAGVTTVQIEVVGIHQ